VLNLPTPEGWKDELRQKPSASCQSKRKRGRKWVEGREGRKAENRELKSVKYLVRAKLVGLSDGAEVTTS